MSTSTAPDPHTVTAIARFREMLAELDADILRRGDGRANPVGLADRVKARAALVRRLAILGETVE